MVFPSGTSTGSSISTRINTTDDTAAEGTHSFTVSIDRSSVTAGSSVTATILDNDSKSGVEYKLLLFNKPSWCLYSQLMML